MREIRPYSVWPPGSEPDVDELDALASEPAVVIPEPEFVDTMTPEEQRAAVERYWKRKAKPVPVDPARQREIDQHRELCRIRGEAQDAIWANEMKQRRAMGFLGI
jgi:hypothetical protein